MSKPAEILVLDDEIIVCERLEEFLTKKGMSVEIYTDSQKAIDRIKEKTFDVIITDIKMQGPSGIDVLAAVKRTTDKTEVIVITGYSSLDTFREAEYIGAFEFIAKPFQMAEIYKLVKKAAKKARK